MSRGLTQTPDILHQNAGFLIRTARDRRYLSQMLGRLRVSLSVVRAALVARFGAVLWLGTFLPLGAAEWVRK